MTPVRSKRSDLIHATYDCRKTACARPCDGWIVEVETAVTCPACIRVAQDIEANGN
jgi:hypothetical protein